MVTEEQGINNLTPNVKLVSYSTPTEDFSEEGLTDVQDLISYCARVSNPSNQFNKKTAQKLILYLIKHKHWSPLEMASACIEIETTRDIAHQIVRHRSFSFQEFSQRYANPNDMGDAFTIRECRLQDNTNRQNSIETQDTNQALRWKKLQEEVGMSARKAYNQALKDGIAKEQARALMPEGLTETTIIVSGSLRSWIHYCQLRMANGTQKEHADIAKMCWEIISGHFPSIAKAME